MTNKEIAQIFYEIADMLEIKGEDRYRILAYRRAADQIAHHVRDMADVAREGKLQDIPGIGAGIASRIEEILATGRLELHEQLREEIPEGVLSFLAIPDVGPRTAWLLFDRLGLTSIAEVEEAARQGRIRQLPGMGAKSEANILRGIQMLHRLSKRILLGTALPVAEELVAGLRECPQARKVTAAGSLRRRKPTIGDIDILAASDEPVAVIETFIGLPRVAEVQAQGDTKATVILDNGLQVDLRVLPRDNYGSLLQYFTGSKEHNIQLRELAQERGLSLSEYGFARLDGTTLPCPEEADVYETLGLAWIPPEMREAAGEVEAAREGGLPRLIELGQVRGDLQMHTSYSDGVHTIEDMARAAMARGYEYIAITDHTKGLGVARGLTAERIREQRLEIEAVNQKLAPFRVLAGAEVEIRADGSLDLSDEVLAELDIVLAAVHSGLRQDRETMTRRVIRAMQNPHVDIIAHPTGRLIGQREPIALDFEAVVAEAVRTGTMLEINAQPSRLDLDGEHARRAIEAGVTLSLGSDAHHAEGLGIMELGVAMARRGWAEAKDVINTLPVEELLARLRKKV
ncbi:MAG: DNA polymerase/3'-5' exonuclease PolX [Anaerolineae bacterium]